MDHMSSHICPWIRAHEARSTLLNKVSLDILLFAVYFKAALSNNWTWWELLIKFFHCCNIAMTQTRYAASWKWFQIDSLFVKGCRWRRKRVQTADVYGAMECHTCESAKNCRMVKEEEKKCNTVGDDGRLEKHQTAHNYTYRKTTALSGSELLYFVRQNHLNSLQPLVILCQGWSWLSCAFRPITVATCSAWQRCLFGTMEKCCIRDILIGLLRTQVSVFSTITHVQPELLEM